MTPFRCFRLVPIAALAVLASACSFHFYDRTTVTLDSGDDEDVQVHYGELDSCLIRQQVPVEYIVRRQRYLLHLHPVPAIGTPAKIELVLYTVGAGTPSLQFPDLPEPPPPLYAENNGVRYLMETKDLGKVLHLVVMRDDEERGTEHFPVTPGYCRVLTPTK